MGFEIREDFRGMLDEVRAFVDERIAPVEEGFLSGGHSESSREIVGLRDDVRSRGWWAPHVARDHGGMGLSFLDHARLTEVLGRSPLGHFVFGCQAPDAGNAEILHMFGSDAQKEAFLEPLAAGNARSCFAMTEPDNPGSNPVQLSTRAVLDGDEWVLDGHKWFITGAHGADFAIVMAVTDPDAASPHGRASMIIVPTDTPGYEFVRRISVMGDVGHGNATHCELRFNGCRVPKANLLGGRGAGFMIAQERLGPGRIHHCMRWLGIAERSFDMMCRRAVEREIAPGKPLASRQTIQNWIAESRSEIDSARLLVLHAAEKMDREGARAARVEISTIKFFVAGMLQRVIDRALQTHGALGMSDDTVLAWFYRHERAARIYDGPDEVHKSVVARRILRAYGGT